MKKLRLCLVLIILANSVWAQWNKIQSLTGISPFWSQSVKKICFLSANRAIYATQGGGIHAAFYDIYKTEDGWGTIGHLYGIGGDYNQWYICDMMFVNDSIGYNLSGYYGFIQANKTINSGASWSPEPYNNLLFRARKLSFLKENFGYFLSVKNNTPNDLVITSVGGIYTTDTIPEKYSSYELYFTNDSTGFILCRDSLQNYICLQTVDSAHNWNEVLNSHSDKLLGIHFPTVVTGYISAENGKLYKTTDGGQSWNMLQTNTERNLNAVYFVNDTLGYTAGDSGLLMKTTNGGQTWTSESTTTTTNINLVYVSENRIGYFVTSDFLLYKNSLLGIEDHKSPDPIDGIVEIYPNPASQFLNICLSGPNYPASARIISIQGSIVAEKTLRTNPEQIDVRFLPPGMYVLQIVRNSNTLSKRFIKE